MTNKRRHQYRLSPALKFPKHVSNLIGVSVLLGALVVAGYWASHGWELTGLSGHEFRQAQTALTIQSMQQDGYRLDYATPVLGKPWSIPMEFPLYQYLVVKWIDLTGQGIAQGARTMSVICFLVGLVAFYRLLRVARFSIGGSCLALVMVVFSPVYVFYSRTVMIESMAWASSAWFLWGLLKFRECGAGKYLTVVWFAGVIAVLVKPTTWAAFCLPWAILFLRDLIWGRERDGESLKRLAIEVLGVGVPLLILGFTWVAYADSLKAQNPIAHFLLSSELRGFNFGSLSMRFDGTHWIALGAHWDNVVMPWPVMMTGLVIALWQTASRRILAIGLGAFFGIQLVFFNLYLLHDYYFFANAAFLTIVLGVGLSAWWDRAHLGSKERLMILLLLGGMAFGQFSRYHTTLYPVQTTYATGDYGLTKAIRMITQKDEVVISHSSDWNSSLAYFTHRRMLMIPDAQMFFHPEKVRDSVALLEGELVPLLLVGREARRQPRWIAERIDQLGLWSQPLFEWENQVTAYARADRYSPMRKILESADLQGITLDHSAELLPEESRIEIVGSPLEDQISSMGFVPTYGVLPYGVSISTTKTGKALLVHATSELFFEIPSNASRVEFEYSINPASFTEKDFDGMSFHMEVLVPSGELLPLKLDWVSPQNEPQLRRQYLDINSVPSGSILLFRALPGPQQNNAYDQGWLHKVEFTIEP